MLPSSDEVPVLQREVQRMLGRCLWKFQQYERLLKAIVAQHEVVGPIGGARLQVRSEPMKSRERPWAR
jgi:hypothetical protein